MTAVAEIPTREAAEAFAQYASRFPDFDELFQDLERAGFPLGIEGRLRCFAVLSRLTSVGMKPADAAQLTKYLLPVLAGSPHEQDSIRRVIETWANRAAKASAKSGTDAASEAAAPRAARELERVDRSGLIFSAGAFGLVVIAICAVIVFSVLSGETPDAATAATSVVSYSQPIVSLDIGLNPFWKRAIEDALSRLGFAAVVLLGGLSFASWRNEIKGRLVRGTDETDRVNTFALTADIDWFRNADARAAFDRLKRVRLFDTDRIDVPQTLAKCTRAGGLPLVVNKRLRELPNYVLLIDRAARDDLAGIFARAVEAALIEARIVYSRYDFSGGLDRLNPVRGGAQEDIVDAEYLPFSVIASRHAGERLILFGAGTGFFEVPGFRFDRDGRRTLVRPGTPVPQTIHLREFSAASLITPAPISAWGENERRLRELGFEIFSADVNGIKSLAAQLTSEPETDAGIPTVARPQSNEDLFLAQLDRDTLRLTADAPPPRTEIDRLIRNLKIWAGSPDVYAVLAAIAAFPKIGSAFILLLAKMMLGKERADNDSADRESALFARLIRLPWIRSRYMPDWLRIGIVNALDPEQRRDVQAVQMTMLKGVEEAGTEGQKTDTPKDRQQLRDQLVSKFEIARQLPRGRFDALVSRILPPAGIMSADERIFFSVLHDYRLDPEREAIEPEAPDVIAEMIDAPERRRRAQMRAIVIGLAAIAAMLQPWVWALATNIGAASYEALHLSGELFADIPDAIPLKSSSLVLVLVAMAQWFINASRRNPLTFLRSNLLLNPRITSFYAIVGAQLELLMVARPPDPNSVAIIDAVLLLIAAGATCAWVSVVTPQLWWNPQSADKALEMQTERDPITAVLGSLLIVLVWQLGWLVAAFPAAAHMEKTPRVLLLAGCACMASSVASCALARRWLIGAASTGPLYRFWMDAGFALILYLFLNLFMPMAERAFPRVGSMTSTYIVLMLLVVTFVVCGIQLKATLGLRDTRPVWGPLINGILAGLTQSWILLIVLDFSRGFTANIPYQLLVSGWGLAGGTVCGVLTARQFRQSDYYGSSSRTLVIKCAGLGAAIFGAVFLFGDTWLSPESPLSLVRLEKSLFGNNFLVSTIVSGFSWVLLSAPLVVWPMFRLLATTFPHERAKARHWLAIADTPWWGTLAMWLVGIVWHVGGIRFSLWPLGLPIGIALWRRYGEHALVPVAVGTLPLLIKIGPSDTTLYTPGGFWPALAILFLARFAADAPFRQRCLRREHLSWPEALLVVLLLMTHLEIPVRTPLLSLDIGTWIYVDPSWMLVTAAFVIGASRMSSLRFATVVVAAWVACGLLMLLGGYGPAPTGFFGLTPGDAAAVLLVLHGARGWRIYAASGIGSEYATATSFDRRLSSMKQRGIWLALAAGASVGILASGVAPTADLQAVKTDHINYWSLAPSAAGTLALVMLLGMIFGNLWADRLSPFVKATMPLAKLFNKYMSPVLWLMFRYIPLAFLSVVSGGYFLLLCLVLAQDPRAFAKFGVGAGEAGVFPPGLDEIGFLACVVVFLVFGAAIRIGAERRNGDSWRETARRLWTAPVRKTDLSEESSTPPSARLRTAKRKA